MAMLSHNIIMLDKMAMTVPSDNRTEQHNTLPINPRNPIGVVSTCGDFCFLSPLLLLLLPLPPPQPRPPPPAPLPPPPPPLPLPFWDLPRRECRLAR
eukprot:8463081-Pyramimonas_sp.AAC.1